MRPKRSFAARQSDPIDRIGVPSYYWGTNAIHGMQARLEQNPFASRSLRRVLFF